MEPQGTSSGGSVDLSALRLAKSHPLSADLVKAHLVDKSPDDRLFESAWRNGLGSIPLDRRRGRLPGVIGHIAESIAESIFVDLAFIPLWHFDSNGGNGVDLLMILPAFDGVVAIEVKGTLRSGRLARLRNAQLGQMTPGWLASPVNAGMIEWDLEAHRVYGAIFVINFADLLFKVAATADFRRVVAVEDLKMMTDLKWLETSQGAQPDRIERISTTS